MYARDHALIATPIGLIRIEGDAATLLRIELSAEGVRQPGTATAVRNAAIQIAAYFIGNLKYFGMPLLAIASARGQVLRDRLTALCYGETASYGELARRLNSGPRAIGQLCARNPSRLSFPAIALWARAGHWVPIQRGMAPQPSYGCSSTSGAIFTGETHGKHHDPQPRRQRRFCRLSRRS